MDKYVLDKADIDAMEGLEKQPFLNPKARRINKSLGDLTRLTAIGFHRTLCGQEMMRLFYRLFVPALLAAGLMAGCGATRGLPGAAGDSLPDSLPDPLAAGWAGEPVCEALHEDARQRVLRCTFPPGVGHERHYHPQHFGYALSGGVMQLDDARGRRVVELATGSSYASDGVPWHEVLNVGDTTVTYLIVEPR